MSAPRVLIAGGGIAGLALAPLLARAGAAVEVVEREPAWRTAGTGMYLPGNAVRALRALGLEAQLAARAVEIPRQRFCDHRGRLLCEVDVGRLWAGVGPCLAVHRADLHEVLREATGGVPIRLGAALERVTQQGEFVSVAFSDGTGGDYDLVVGADGVHSSVRRLVFGPATTPQPVGQVSWRFLAPRPVEATTWSAMLGGGTTFLSLPLDQDRVYCYCDAASSTDPERLGDLFAGFADPVPALLAGADAVHVATIEEVVLDSCVRDRVVLIGDAAHATSPNMAQGAAMALEDALVLAACLRDIAALADALAAFRSRRSPRTDWVRAQTHRRDHTRSLAPAVRNTVMRVAGRRIFRANYRPLLAEP